MMQLPGGLWHDNRRRRDFRFKPVTGALSFAIAELGAAGAELPETVDAVLCEALANLGGMPPSVELVSTLCVADRQYLMRQLQLHMGDKPIWHSAECRHCRQPFDFELDLANLPVVEGNADYPFVDVALGDDQMRFRLPSGADQQALALVEQDAATAVILDRCMVEGNLPVDALDDAQVAQIEQAMDDAAPGIVTELSVTCAHCGEANGIYLDPYQLLNRGYGSLLQEVHTLASNYHWSERDILDMPAARRAMYLKLIDAARGMTR